MYRADCFDSHMRFLGGYSGKVERAIQHIF